tara:strand:- start:1993 stop:2184 length:192 start_codon:yes stop_codon:yes gene_type:complete
MYVFENDIKFQAGPYKMFDEVTKPNKIERAKSTKQRLKDKKQNKEVPEYLIPINMRYSYLKGR